MPSDKLAKALTTVSILSVRRKVTLQELQEMLGFLNFTCSVIVPGRAFLRRLFSATHGLTRAYHHARITSGMRADLAAWKISCYISMVDLSFYMTDGPSAMPLNFIPMHPPLSALASFMVNVGSMVYGPVMLVIFRLF